MNCGSRSVALDTRRPVREAGLFGFAKYMPHALLPPGTKSNSPRRNSTSVSFLALLEVRMSALLHENTAARPSPDAL